MARKILSCVARVGQRFGAGHVSNVLRGRRVGGVVQRGHDSLSTFGLLRDATADEVRGYIDQLTAQGLLQQTGDPYPVLQLTARGVELMRTGGGDAPCALVRQRRPSEGRLPAHARARVPWSGVDMALFERLRGLRLQLARARGVPPYVIFHDATLRELARLKPRTLDAMSGVHGMGERKIASFGAIVLDEIRAHG